MKGDKIKQTKHGAYLLRREGKDYALVVEAAAVRGTKHQSCAGCAFAEADSTAVCPMLDGTTDHICIEVDISRALARNNKRSVWHVLA